MLTRGSASWVAISFSVAIGVSFGHGVVSHGGENTPPEGFKALFNGQDLAGWHGMGHFDPRVLAAMSEEDRAAKRAKDLEDVAQHWSVENGELVNDGHGVYLTTDESYGDVELMIDYKTVAKADSGIYLRATPQVQIWDTSKEGGSWKHGAAKGSGGLWNNPKGSAGKDPLVHADKPLGEWNSMKIKMVGEIMTDEYYGMVLPKEDIKLKQRIDLALKTLIENGTVEALHAKWELGLAAAVPEKQ